MHDPLNIADLLDDEIRQLTESGYDTSSAKREHLDIAPDGAGAMELLYTQLGDLTRLKPAGTAAR